MELPTTWTADENNISGMNLTMLANRDLGKDAQNSYAEADDAKKTDVGLVALGNSSEKDQPKA